MDYKIKYHDALEGIRELYNSDCDMIRVKRLRRRLEHIFPELKESEDERIRKGIIRNLQYLMDRSEGFVKEDLQERIVWLESKAEQSTDKIESNPAWSEEDEKMLKWLCRIIHTLRLDRVITLKEESELGEWMDKWLNYNPQTKQSEQLTDKIKPRFKEGDWITDGRITCKVLGVTSKSYELHLHNDDYCHFETDIQSVDKYYRLWTIQDAMDGDVLVAKDDRPFIFTGEFDVQDDNPTAYCGINSSDKFITGMGSHWTFKDGIKPATKEQRDLLFQKMKEAGYEWDAQKKEVKKSTDEVEPRFKEGDFIMNNDITEDGKPEIFKIIKVCSSWYDVENVYDGRQTMITFSQDYTCHLWTIDDAKQGDILVVDNEYIVVLYRKITDGTEWKDTSILTEYQYDINDNTFTKGSHLFYYDICPATYTQREVLTNYIQKELN